jgi:hypothetical protein
VTIRTTLCTILLATGLAASSAPAGARPPDRDVQPTAPTPTTATVTPDQLGPGAVIATVAHGDFTDPSASGLRRSLEVISPDGVRHRVYDVRVRRDRAGWQVGDFRLADWRPEMHTALLRVSSGAEVEKAVSYDVVTGETHEVVLQSNTNTVGLSPDGTGVLLTTFARKSRPGRVVRHTWAGTTSGIPADADGVALASVDGRLLITRNDDGWALTDHVARTSTTMPTRGSCTPLRWMDADAVMASCRIRQGSQLRRMGLDGTSSALGVRHSEKQRRSGVPIFDDDDVRVVQGRRWYESYGGCGGGMLTTQTSRGKVRLVRLPGRAGALNLLGARGDSLFVALQEEECGSRASRAVLALVDPVTRRVSVLTRLGRGQSWSDTLPADEVRSWVG